eukprot:Hpha_TRINITY_DN14325_c0_g1::TRINITY_DN14325_c0_g1_i2::g.87041::m.87041
MQPAPDCQPQGQPPPSYPPPYGSAPNQGPPMVGAVPAYPPSQQQPVPAYPQAQVVHVGQPVGQAPMMAAPVMAPQVVTTQVVVSGPIPGGQSAWQSGWCMGFWLGCCGYCCASQDKANRMGTNMGCSWNNFSWGICLFVLGIILLAVPAGCHADTVQIEGCLRLGGNPLEDLSLRCAEWGTKCCEERDLSDRSCELAYDRNACAAVTLGFFTNGVCMWNDARQECVTDCQKYWSHTGVPVVWGVLTLIAGLIVAGVGIFLIARFRKQTIDMGLNWKDCCC